MNPPVKVKFQECTKAEYEAMSQHFNNIVYSCYDTGELFKGNIAFGGGSEPGPGPEPTPSGIYIVDYTIDSDQPGEDGGVPATPTHSGEAVTFDEIYAAIAQKFEVIAVIGGATYLNLITFGTEQISFNGTLFAGDNGIMNMQINQNKDGSAYAYSNPLATN